MPLGNEGKRVNCFASHSFCARANSPGLTRRSNDADCIGMREIIEKLQAGLNDRNAMRWICIAAICLLALTAGMLPRLTLGPGQETGLGALLTGSFVMEGASPWSSPGGSGAGNLPGYMLPLFWGALLLTAVYAVVSPQFRKAVMGSLIIVLLLTFALTRMSQNMAEREAETARGPGRADMPGSAGLDREPPQPPAWVEDPPDWIPVAAGTAAAAAAAPFLYMLWQRYGSREEEAAAQIRAHAEDALSSLDSGEALRGTIQRCYSTMLRTFEIEQKVSRSAAMTTRDFETHLAGVGLHSRHVRNLSRLFEHSRFGDKPETAGDREQARDCLRNVVDNLSSVTG